MWLGIKCFEGEAKFRRQKIGWKDKQTNKQFGVLSTEETQEITDNAISVTTKSIKVRNSNIQRYVPIKFPLKAKLNFKH